ncbi:MAG: hypoxanthine phosphoribosyltransferase [Deltaproteobacteria bacterium]|nr:hypoxanthine phosphoribosyltransferase [Deltaproteobacteria bacterium]
MTSFFQQDKLAVLFDAAAVAARVSELGRAITAHYASAIARGEELVVVGVLKGSFVFLADLVRAIDAPCHIEFMGVSSYGDATESSGVVQVTQDLTRPIKNKHLLLVEDIVDTGLTMKYLLDNLATRGPRSVKLASLLEKPSKNAAGVEVDFLGFSIPDQFVVGYGLDAAGLYRNLPYVGLVMPPKSEGQG